MDDSCGRTVRYLRLSVTPVCAMRCVYCQPTLSERRKAGSILTADEIETMVGHLVQHHGLKKVRVTGGEPANRPDLITIIRRLAGLKALNELVMTTNGLTLARQARALADAGLQRVNVSLDSLDRDQFQRITGVDGIQQVVDGIDAAIQAGLTPVKLNTVLIRGENDDQLPDLVKFAAQRGLEIRFIELMPMGPLAASWKERFLPERQMRLRLNSLVASWHALPMKTSPARRYQATLVDGRQVTIGFIMPMSEPFCGRCDRIRIAADGMFYPCLMGSPAGNLMPTIRPAFDPNAFNALLGNWLQHRAPKHPAAGAAIMTYIGG